MQGASGSLPPLVSSYLGFAETNSGSVLTKAGLDLGAAPSGGVKKWILIGAHSRVYATIDDVTVGGVSASQFAVYQGSEQMFWAIVESSLTSADVVVDYASNSEKHGFGVWSILAGSGVDMTLNADLVQNGTDNHSIFVPEGGACFSTLFVDGGSTASYTAGLTTRFTNSFGGSNERSAGGSDDFAAEQNNLTVSVSGSSDSLSTISFGPKGFE